MSRQQGLMAYCPRCRNYRPADTFAGMTAYNKHTVDGVRVCKNSNQPTHYKAKQFFAGGIVGGRTNG